ncbi:MAG: hypothetical protein DMF71_06080 [Acidobacteria bacterium]|nr:MAG: hypothetical protein DMF71_06080 [Acidobacteriota bacterium]
MATVLSATVWARPVDGRRQTADSRRQKAEGRRQEADRNSLPFAPRAFSRHIDVVPKVIAAFLLPTASCCLPPVL